MKPIKQLWRIAEINLVLARNGLDKLLVTIPFFVPFRFITYFNPWNWFRRDYRSAGEALRISLEQLGPIFIKFGQALSTRPDILPPEIAEELCKLQDNVPPFSSEMALAILEEAYKKSAFELFAEFNEQSLASASMAQVHAAKLKTGEDVVVKILRPNLGKVIENDLAILYTLARLADKYWPDGKRFKPIELVREFEHSLMDEMDLQREAANASQLRRNFQNSPLLHVPEIYWDYTRENVLVMERIHGISISDIASLKAHNINIKKLAQRGVEIFFTQVFRDCFFHADMHPGNIFVSYENPEDPQYICIDFGIVGTLNDNDKRYLAENFHAFFKRDYRRVAELHVESGWVSRDTRVDEFESAIRTVCEPIFERPLKDISLGHLTLRLFQVARRFHMQVQPQLLLLQKTLLAIEGLGRQLYPELDLWTTASPFLEKWMREQVSLKSWLRQLRANVPFMVEQLPHMPRLMYEVLELSKAEKLQHLMAQNQPKKHLSPRRAWFKGLAFGVFLSVMVIGSALLLGSAFFLEH